MPFDPVDPKQSFPALERAMIEYWKEEGIFQRSLHARKEGEKYSFYDGPPFATGLPHYGHILAGTIKDVIPRYQTMRGKYVERRFGWDCHGLPIENLIEKEHDIKSKRDIEAMGVAKFNELCKASVQRYTTEWRTVVERMGRFVDMDHDYRTMDPDFMASIWWVFSQVYEKGLLYEGHRPIHICPRCATPLSNFEVGQGYKDVTDHTATAMFELTDEPGTYVLAWTTTPWTLPGNLLLAVGPDVTYRKVLCEAKKYIVAEALMEKVFEGKEYEPEPKKITAKSLVGKTYKPLFPYFVDRYPNAFRIVLGDFVTTEDGTGVVHIAPGFGEDDFLTGKREKLDLLQHVTMEGRFTKDVTDFADEEVKPAKDPAKTDRSIAAWLNKHGLLFKEESYRHSYPHCWRCDTPLLNYATSSWFVAVEKIKDRLLENAEKIRWMPDFLKEGRFGKWLEGARDWSISRNRYWGTPLPIWKSDAGEVDVISSRDELMQRVQGRFTKMTFLRHGESESNVQSMYQSKIPGVPLTEKGQDQAKNAASFLGDGKRGGRLPVNIIYCSPLQRTMQTAQAIADETGAQIIVDERLREVEMGPHEGHTVPVADMEKMRALRKRHLARSTGEGLYNVEGMETWESIQSRINSFLTETLPKHVDEHVVVVLHGDPLFSVRHFFTKNDPKKIANNVAAFASPESYFYDHAKASALDLHKETVDEISWKDGKGNVYKRIPDVLDCWFESGSMPYAQIQFPHLFASNEIKKKEIWPVAFPADFIAEGVDQTRLWFYTLHVLGTILFDAPAYKNVVVNGIVLAEDGRKMSKRLKNYPDPMEVAERHGADALRFSLMQSPVVRAEDLRFSERAVEETVRSVLLPLWNSYAFFVTYAGDFTPSTKPSVSPHALDRWIIAEVQHLCNQVTKEMEHYDLSATCDEMFHTIDALTNWYIRLSRRRFAGKEAGAETDREHALNTLYNVLLDVTTLLAPFCPFVTEAIYQNLVSEKHGSIHLTNWPATRALTKEENQLRHVHNALQLIVSLGNKLRSEQKVKIRQPLQSATIALPKSLLNAKELSVADRQLLMSELNVKELHFTDDAGTLGQAIAMVDARKVGPRLGGRVQQIIQLGKQGQFTVQEDGSVLIDEEHLNADEVQILYKAEEGRNVAADKGVIVSLDTRVSDELLLEGLARDLIRQIQKLRKEQGCAINDTVEMQIDGADDVLTKMKEMIESETRIHLSTKSGSRHDVTIGEDRTVTIIL